MDFDPPIENHETETTTPAQHAANVMLEALRNHDSVESEEDEDCENAEDYACGDMRFRRKGSTPKILAKYSITEIEYAEVASKLEDGLSFGSCGWCV